LALATGARLGPYEITAPLGAGGMGEVYRARDTKLGRDVALKILPDSFAADPERVARFKREAQVLASLNHPHIGAIYGLEESAATQFLVLELVDGETLAARIGQRAKGKGLPVNEALAIARQIADALEAAHEKGIVHRDLKPANIALTANDQVKVLDFGLAKALDGGHSSNAMNSPTLSLHATQAGVILGTAAYMSPEQAKGRIADKRSDVWSFGCVLFEMFSGRRAFEGEDVSDTLAGILRGDPEWAALPAQVPAAVRALIVNCLKKDRSQRTGDIAVARYVLGEPIGAAPETPTLAPAQTPRRLWVGFAAVAAAAFVAAAGGWALKPEPKAPEKHVTRFPLLLTAEQTIVPSAASRHLLAYSADGARLVFAANNQLFVRALDQVEAAPIRGTSESPFEPVVSPDGQWVAYFATGHLKKIAVGGGAPTTLCEAQAPWGMSWDGDRILFGEGPDGIFEVSANGGPPKRIIGGKPAEFLHQPHLLPGGQAVLFTIGSASAVIDRWSSAAIAVESLKTGERKVLVRGGTDAQYVSTGHLLYGRDGVLFANAFDLSRLELRGGPTAVVEGIAQASGGLTGALQLAASAAGSIAYLPASAGALTTIAWRSREGADSPIPAPPHNYETPRLSPDGTRIAVHASDQDNDIWIWDTKSETLTRLTFDKSTESAPAWTRDGKRVIFTTSAGDAPSLAWKAADGTGQQETLLRTRMSNGALVSQGATPDGKGFIYSVGVPADVVLLPFEGNREPRPLMALPAFNERGGDVSPDGRWIVYYSDESGVFQVYVRPFPAVDGGRWQVSGEGGTLPKWSPNGRELFYVDSKMRLVSVAVQTGGAFSFGKTTVLFDVSDAASVLRNYDVAPDGSRFVVVKSTRTRGTPQLTVVENWFEELKQRVPVGR
jgi:eukaryotic-like serine/threonine-protein kinase